MLRVGSLLHRLPGKTQIQTIYTVFSSLTLLDAAAGHSDARLAFYSIGESI
jgi:hypothetical protein